MKRCTLIGESSNFSLVAFCFVPKIFALDRRIDAVCQCFSASLFFLQRLMLAVSELCFLGSLFVFFAFYLNIVTFTLQLFDAFFSDSFGSSLVSDDGMHKLTRSKASNWTIFRRNLGQY